MDKRYKVFRWVFTAFFVIFLTLYFSQLTGYYEYQNYKKMTMTEEQIALFEQDIKDGKEVDIQDYVIDTSKDYKNGISSMGLKFSTGVSDVIKNGVIKLFGTISGFVSE